MTFYVENETESKLAFSAEEIVKRVAQKVLDMEKCPYEVTCNVLLTDNEGIRTYNREHRNIDKATDVLSFPNIEYETPADFRTAEENAAGCFEPDSGELMLGDIIVSLDKVNEQAVSYGHSKQREFAFLIAHSVLHLCGYDHMEEQEALTMEKKQEAVLNLLGITRD